MPDQGLKTAARRSRSRDLTRPPVAQDRLERRTDGKLDLGFKKPRRDGTRAFVLELGSTAPAFPHVALDAAGLPPNWRLQLRAAAQLRQAQTNRLHPGAEAV